MTPLEMITEWRQGCSCAGPLKPEECPTCTVALIEALEKRLRDPLSPQIDGIARRAALDIAHMWGQNRTDFVAKIAHRVEAAIYAGVRSARPREPLAWMTADAPVKWPELPDKLVGWAIAATLVISAGIVALVVWWPK